MFLVMFLVFSSSDKNKPPLPFPFSRSLIGEYTHQERHMNKEPLRSVESEMKGFNSSTPGFFSGMSRAVSSAASELGAKRTRAMGEKTLMG